MKYSLNLLFSLLVPLLCEGLTVQLKMPSYMGMNSREMRVTCAFTADKQLTKMFLLHGDAATGVSYQITLSKFEIVPNNKITLEVSSGTTVRGGSLIFVFSRISCSDFTSYRCKGDGDFTFLVTDNKTLQVSPVVDSILKTSRSDIIVNQMSTFACRGTISKGGPYSVQWYLRTITSSSQLRAEQAKVIGQNQCSRSVSSSLTYNVSETHGLTLIFWCRIESGRTVDRMGNFTIQEISTTLSTQPVKDTKYPVKAKYPVTTAPTKSCLSVNKVNIIWGAVVIILLIVFMLVALAFYRKKLQNAKRTPNTETTKDSDIRTRLSSNIYDIPLSENNSINTIPCESTVPTPGQEVDDRLYISVYESQTGESEYDVIN